MLKIRFLVDFQGRETGNQFFKAGEVGEFSRDAALMMIAEGRAVAFEQPAAPVETEQPAPKKRGK